MYLLIDNYDSFTFNLWHYLSELGAEVEVARNDKISVAEVLKKKLNGLILSPGPCNPDKAGISLELVEAAAKNKLPVFGVCLGFQTIGQVFKAKVVKAPKPMHGKVSEVSHNSHEMFNNIPKRFKSTRYHSLILERSSFPNHLQITAEASEGIIMALAHKDLPLYGVQFHPASIASEFGHQVIKNFLNIT